MCEAQTYGDIRCGYSLIPSKEGSSWAHSVADPTGMKPEKDQQNCS